MLLIALAAAAAQPLRPELAAFGFLAGHCWVGRSPDGKPDTHCFESVFDGQHFRDRHVVPGRPAYRGETLYSWNGAARRIDYVYWNSLGDVYRGVARPVNGGIDFSPAGAGDTTASIHWRWSGRAVYVVAIDGRAPIRFVRERSLWPKPLTRHGAPKNVSRTHGSARRPPETGNPR